jgi:N-acetylmuramoyl-L-alanine amidase
MAVNIIGKPYVSGTKVRKTTDWLVVHCSATQCKADIGATKINEWHRAKGWKCIGYHYVIHRDGLIEYGRDTNVIGAHVEDHNANSIGICLVGGVGSDGKTAENNFTKDQFKSLKALLIELKSKYPKAVIQGHRDFPDVHKDCPCFDTKAWVKEVKI